MRIEEQKGMIVRGCEGGVEDEKRMVEGQGHTIVQ